MKTYNEKSEAYIRSNGLTKLYIRQPNGEKTAILLTENQIKEKKAKGVTLYESAR